MPDDINQPRFFADGPEFRAWLAENHANATAMVVGFPKVGSGIAGITYQEALDAALAFGWIDGVRKRIDDQRWQIRFSPRKKGSIWSAVNLARVEELIAAGLMEPAGLAVHANRVSERERVYAYENRPQTLPEEHSAIFQTHPDAWQWFQVQAPSYQRTMIWWVVSAKQEATRAKRLQQLIDACKEKRRIQGG